MCIRDSNEFTLYEDQGEDLSYDVSFVKTKAEVSENDGKDVTFTLHPSEGDLSLIPEKRNLSFSFADVSKAQVKVYLNEVLQSDETCNTQPIVCLNGVKPTDKVTIVLTDYKIRVNPAVNEVIAKVMARWQKGYFKKNILYSAVKKKVKSRDYKSAVKRSLLPKRLKEEIYENLD